MITKINRNISNFLLLAFKYSIFSTRYAFIRHALLFFFSLSSKSVSERQVTALICVHIVAKISYFTLQTFFLNLLKYVLQKNVFCPTQLKNRRAACGLYQGRVGCCTAATAPP